MGLEVLQIDAFTNVPFKGNPAAVVVLPAARDDRWLQAFALEMNLSETAYLIRRGDGSYDLRWFTPASEVDLCGHATLASAHALYEKKLLRADEEARFHTRSGLLTVKRGADGWMEMNFPGDEPGPMDMPEDLIRALGRRPIAAYRCKFDCLAEFATEKEVRELKPDMTLLKKFAARGVIVTAPSSSPEFDFVSRFFAPAFGIEEDPVTGSAHCTLACHWSPKLGKKDMMAYQASPRGGVVRVGYRGERVLLGGQAVTVMRGELIEND
jgi:PhzF family phenazine biosynthesis protein